MNPSIYDTVIVGGGVIGLFTAWELNRAGQSVCVIDRGAMGREASWAAGGILSPLRPWRYPAEVNALSVWSQSRYAAICAELFDATGVDCEWRCSGMLMLDCPEFAAALEWADRQDQHLEMVTPEDLAGRFPGVSSTQATQPVFLPQAAQLRTPRLVQALCQRLAQSQVTLCPDTRMQGLLIQGNRVTGVETAGGRLCAEQVVIAAGAWSAALVPGQGRHQRLQPVKGQMLLYEPQAELPTNMLMLGDRYLVPRCDGRLLVGSSLEHAGFDKSTDSATLADLQAIAVAIYPSLSSAGIEASWAGLRPATADERPIIGPHADIEGLFLNTGHYRSGIVTAPASARLLADLMLSRPAFIPPVYRP